MRAQRLEDLDTWRLCDELVNRLIAATASGPVSKDFRFCNQLHDAAGDALSDVAEGYARYYPREFGRFLDYAVASLEEVRTRITLGYRRKYFDEQTASDLLNLCLRAESAARALRAYLWTVKKHDLPPHPISPAPRRAGRRRRTP